MFRLGFWCKLNSCDANVCSTVWFGTIFGESCQPLKSHRGRGSSGSHPSKYIHFSPECVVCERACFLGLLCRNLHWGCVPIPHFSPSFPPSPSFPSQKNWRSRNEHWSSHNLHFFGLDAHGYVISRGSKQFIIMWESVCVCLCVRVSLCMSVVCGWKPSG